MVDATIISAMQTLLQAMSVSEGFPILGSRSQRNNNPGDLTWGEEAQRFGAIRGDGRFAVFPDPVTGWRAFQRWLSVPAKFTEVDPGDGRPVGPSGYLIAGYLGATVAQVIHRFSPPAENNTAAYVSGVCERTGLTPDTIVTSEILETPEAV